MPFPVIGLRVESPGGDVRLTDGPRQVTICTLTRADLQALTQARNVPKPSQPDDLQPRPTDRTDEARALENRTVPCEAGLRSDRAAASSLLAAVLPEIKLMTGMVTAALIIGALYFGREILMPLALAFLLGFVLEPLVRRLRRIGLPQVPAVALVVLSTLALLGFAALLLGKQVSLLSAQLPLYQGNVTTKFQALQIALKKPGMFDGAAKAIEVVQTEVEKTLAPKEEAKTLAATAAEPAAPVRVQVVERAPTSLQRAIGWLEASGGSLATAGIVLVFAVLVLLDRQDLRDRLLRLWGGNLHRSTEAMDEAGERISKYLTMQLVVNLSYGVPIAGGLWAIGIPGAFLWGAVAAVMRFVPYVGPMIAAVFPLFIAIAVDPGWSMVLWTLALILMLEMLINNLVEPWLYGSSTGLSAMSLMVAATFWTALWGPVGLIMSTPLTVCLLVVGRHLPRLAFLNVLLGSQPALDTPTRIYQRLLAGEVEQAIELAEQQAGDANVSGFYNTCGLPVLRMATDADGGLSNAEHRMRIVVGMDALIDDLYEEYPPPSSAGDAQVVCIGGQREVDTLAARMLAHALSLDGHRVQLRPAARVTAEFMSQLDLSNVQAVCLSYFSAEPQVAAKHFCRRLKRRWPDTKIVLALWNAPPELMGEDACKALGADAVVTSLSDAAMRLTQLIGAEFSEGFMEAPMPEAEADAKRLAAVHASGALDPRAQLVFDAAAERVAEIFDVPVAMVSLIGEDKQLVCGLSRQVPLPDGSGDTLSAEDLNIPRGLSLCGHAVANAQTLVVPDVTRDPRFAGNPALQAKGVRFYAGAPLRDAGGFVLGTLCILDFQPRTVNPREQRLLEAMAKDLMAALKSNALQWDAPAVVEAEVPAEPSAIVGQVVPAAG